MVRFISNLASGDLLCIVNDLSDNTTNLDVRSLSSLYIKAICFILSFLQIHVCTVKLCFSFGTSSLSGPFHISLSAYAAQEPGCKEKVKLSHFFPVSLQNSAVYFLTCQKADRSIFTLLVVVQSVDVTINYLLFRLCSCSPLRQNISPLQIIPAFSLLFLLFTSSLRQMFFLTKYCPLFPSEFFFSSFHKIFSFPPQQ